MIGVASLVGAVLGIYFRNAMDTSQTFRRSALIGVRGALMMGVVVGYLLAGAHTPGDPPALGVGVATAMLTFCLFTPTAIAAFRRRSSGTIGLSALALGVIGLAAGSLGTVVGVLAA